MVLHGHLYNYFVNLLCEFGVLCVYLTVPSVQVRFGVVCRIILGSIVIVEELRGETGDRVWSGERKGILSSDDIQLRNYN